MTPETIPQLGATTPPRRRWPRRLALAAAITLVALLAGHLVWYMLASAELTRARAAAASAGLSQDPAVVIPPPCTDADNAALRYQQAYGLLTLGGMPYVSEQSAGELDPRLAALLEPMTSEKAWESAIAADAAAALRLLDHEDFARAWRLVAEGARLPRCRFACRYEAGAAMRMPQVGLVRKIAQLGSLRARLLAVSGRGQEAADQFADLLWMLRQYRRDEPVLIGLLVSISAENLVLGHLRRALEDGQLAGADLVRSGLALDDAQRAAGWDRVLQGEVALFGTWAFRNIDSGAVPATTFEADPGPGARSFYGSWLAAPLRAGDEACYLRLFTDMKTGRLQPGQEAAISAWHPLTRMLTPAFSLVQHNLTMNVRLCAAAELALGAAAGGTPTKQPGIVVERDVDGGWLISPSVDFDPGNLGRKTLAPWRVPAPRASPVAAPAAPPPAR